MHMVGAGHRCGAFTLTGQISRGGLSDLGSEAGLRGPAGGEKSCDAVDADWRDELKPKDLGFG